MSLRRWDFAKYAYHDKTRHIPPGGSFQLPLGTDPTLRVAYAPVRTHKRIHIEPGFTFPGLQKQPKQETTNSSIAYNDHVPVRNDLTVKVKVTSPQGLRKNNGPAEDDPTTSNYKKPVYIIGTVLECKGGCILLGSPNPFRLSRAAKDPPPLP
ncbi:hypothetical protein B0J17DRAFT_624046 [Rhizoctonia solani]|nr:hypothetical protein B0J17DRAFT_624046 [Rhizoctonia solani]